MYKLPFGLPSQLPLPGRLGTLSGDVVVLVYIFILLLIVSLFYFAFIAWYYRRRARRAAPVLVRKVLADRGVTMGSSTPEFVVDPSTIRTMTQLAANVPYAIVLEHLAAHLARKGARDMCVGEMQDGFLLLYVAGGTGVVETLTRDQVVGIPMLKRKMAAAAVYRHLGQIGRFLDQQSALSIRLAEQQSGYYIEFATPSAGYPATAKVVRVSRFLDQEALTRLATR